MNDLDFVPTVPIKVRAPSKIIDGSVKTEVAEVEIASWSTDITLKHNSANSRPAPYTRI